MNTRVLIALLAGAAGVIAVAPGLRRPTPLARPGRDIAGFSDVVAEASQSGSTGWELVEHARALVAKRFDTYSCEHPTLDAEAALALGSGFSVQYNGALKEVLEALGFEVDAVFAARTRSRNTPWWHSGHMWLVVTCEGESREVCAQYSRPDGTLRFDPASEVLAFGARTDVDTRAVLVITSAYQWWKRMLTGRDYPLWFKHPFGELV